MTSQHLSRNLGPLSRDDMLLFITRTACMFAYGFLPVVLMLYLVQVGLNEIQIGLLLTLHDGSGES
jgi:hypothetical protein